VVMFAAFSWPGMVAVTLLLPIIRLVFGARPVFNRWTVLSLIGTSVLYLLFTIDPYGFLEWAFD
jgi:hypothetical protein